MTAPLETTVRRRLFSWEIQEARRVFGEDIDYNRVWIHEHAWLPIGLERMVRLLRGNRTPGEPNALTLGNHCLFPERLLSYPVEPSSQEHYKIAWLIHELTHVWQFQRFGWRYLFEALDLQLRQGITAYYYGGAAGLLKAIAGGKNLADFNLEQQGEISRAYYNRLVRGYDVSAWQPFIDEMKRA